MAHCKNCGDIGVIKQDTCPHCGQSIQKDEPDTFKNLEEMSKFDPQYGKTKPINGKILFVIGFFIPVMSILLGLVWKGSRTDESDALLKGAMTAILLLFITTLILVLLSLIM